MISETSPEISVDLGCISSIIESDIFSMRYDANQKIQQASRNL